MVDNVIMMSDATMSALALDLICRWFVMVI